MAYDPEHDISEVSMIPLWNSKGGPQFVSKMFQLYIGAAYAARLALAYPGKP
jgi:hypothetical protein